MRGRWRNRFLAAALIALWLAPGAGALFLDLYAEQPHGDHGSGPHQHSTLVEELAAAVSHGHHHPGATVPEHDHPAEISKAPGSGPPAVPAAAAPLAAATSPHNDGPSRCSGARYRRGPPEPLFYTHCSLLL